jgi:hypothetical protein
MTEVLFLMIEANQTPLIWTTTTPAQGRRSVAGGMSYREDGSFE